MRKTIRIAILFLLFQEAILSQGFSNLLKDDFDRKSTLLIQNEVRKALGSKANSQEVQDIVKKLLPWTRMEEFSPQQFAKAVSYLYESEKAGISFENNEELLPMISNYKGSKEDFLLLSRFMREAEDSKLPLLYRDELIVRGLDKKWEPMSVLVAGRLLILSRNEDIHSGEYFNRLIREFPSRFSRLSTNDSRAVIQRLTSEFKNPITIQNLSRIQEDFSELRSSRGSQLTTVLSSKSRSLDIVFEDLGKLELRRRPPAFIEDIQPVPNPEKDPEPIPSTTSWKNLNIQRLNAVVKGWIGTRYKFGGNTKAGVDCSGFTLHVLTDPQIGVPRNMIPRRATLQADIGVRVTNPNMRVGDLVFFSASPNQTKITHVGLVMENRNFSHASSTRGVVIQSLDSKWWKERYVTSRRIFENIK